MLKADPELANGYHGIGISQVQSSLTLYQTINNRQSIYFARVVSCSAVSFSDVQTRQ